MGQASPWNPYFDMQCTSRPHINLFMRAMLIRFASRGGLPCLIGTGMPSSTCAPYITRRTGASHIGLNQVHASGWNDHAGDIARKTEMVEHAEDPLAPPKDHMEIPVFCGEGEVFLPSSGLAFGKDHRQPVSPDIPKQSERKRTCRKISGMVRLALGQEVRGHVHDLRDPRPVPFPVKQALVCLRLPDRTRRKALGLVLVGDEEAK